MKTFLFFALILATTTTKATNFYFSNLYGDDSRTAVAARNPATPWKSLNKLNAHFISFKPGDSLLLERGNTFFGTIHINKSGTPAKPIVIGAYGIGEDPVITGLISLTFISKGNGLWMSKESLQLPALNLVTVNNVPAGMGRWPNLDNGNGGYDSIRSVTRNSITDKVGLTTSPSAGKPTYFVGAEIVIRTKRWLLDRHPITEYDKYSSTIKFDPFSTNERHTPNFGYFIQDDSTILDRQNEWWYNRKSRKLKIYSRGAPANVSAANLQNLLISIKKNYITIDNITFNGCNSDAIISDDGSHFIIQNCTIQNIGRNGIVADASHSRFLNNKIIDIMSKGIMIDHDAEYSIIKNNLIRNISQIAGLGTSQQEDKKSSATGDGIFIKGKSVIVEHNTFIKIGYAAVHLTKVDSVIIQYNFIDTVCNVYDDGGAIYCYSGTKFSNYGRQIRYNIMLHGIGAFHGSGVNGASAAGAGVAGIYNDLGTSGVEENFNTVAYFEKGIFMNYGSDRIKVTNNTFYHNANGIQINTRKKDKTRNLSVNGNISMAVTKAQKSMYTYSDDGDVLNLFGAIDHNYYAQPISDKMTLSWQTNKGKLNTFAGNLSEWQAKFPKYDANSKKGPKTITNVSELKFAYNETNVPKIVPLQGSYIDARGNSYTNRITLQPFTSTVLMVTSVVVQPGAPTVSITNPSNNENFQSPASINITAAAADANGSVTKVEFYEGDVLLGTQFTSPYSITWNNVTRGSYILTAIATDNSGLITTSSAVNISVGTSKIAPSVSITNPVINANFKTPASINITASATDDDGSIVKVEFYRGNVLLGTEFNSPYSITWNKVASGNYILTAIATDNSGLVTTSSAVNISVGTTNIAPTVSITSPAINENFDFPASINITASATDADGAVDRVEFYNGNVLLATESTNPYSITWNNVAPGNYVLTAKAIDNKGLVTTSSAVKISVGTTNVAPTVSITSPAINENFDFPASINITASATDADGAVDRVEFYNGNVLLATESTNPYSITWNNVAPGNYVLTAKAIDNKGLVTTSSAVKISVEAINVAPTVSITSPAINENFDSPASINITASATDADGAVDRVEFYNGNVLLATESTNPYSITWNNVAPGNYVLTAKAIDNKGLVTTSSAVKISVEAINLAPEVYITAPAIDASFFSPASINITASATDADGSVASVEFYHGNVLLGTEFTNPYSITWNNVAPGNYILTAKAIDNRGLVTTSSAVNLSVGITNVAPLVSITSPLINANYVSPASINISASATDADGSIASVEFYSGTTLLTIEKKFPYSWNWNDVPAGKYSIIVKATDNDGMVTISAPVNVSVLTSKVAPKVSLTSPVANAKFNSLASINISAAASDDDGTISRVEFYNSGTLLTIERKLPYSWDWNDVPAGKYTIVAKAFDDNGLVTSSVPVTVSVITTNMAPKVLLTSPVANAVYNDPEFITITAEATDADGSIKKVEFYSGSVLLTTQVKFPYSWKWQDAPVGKHTITARATDNAGLSTISQSILIDVTAGNVAYSGVAKRSNSAGTISVINENQTPDIAIGPNPASNVLSVFTNKLPKNKKMDISILSMSGALLKKITSNTSNRIIQVNISTLRAGSYQLRIQTNDRLIFKPFEKL